MSTVGLNEATIKKYIREQGKQDILKDKLITREYAREPIISPSRLKQESQHLLGAGFLCPFQAPPSRPFYGRS